jgi:hypothetical protein
MDGWMDGCVERQEIVCINKKKTNTFYHRKRKRTCFDKEIYVTFLYHHIAGTAAKPHADNPRKIARVTSPSPRLCGIKDFPKQPKKIS